MKILLIRKLANRLDGIDLSACTEGDAIELPHRDASLLLAEGWASRAQASRAAQGAARRLGTLSGGQKQAMIRQLRRAIEQLDIWAVRPVERRRAEDRLRDELHDRRATTVPSGRRSRPGR